MSDDKQPKQPPKDICASCGLPVIPVSAGVSHYGKSGVTIEHQACWQSRTFGERHD